MLKLNVRHPNCGLHSRWQLVKRLPLMTRSTAQHLQPAKKTRVAVVRIKDAFLPLRRHRMMTTKASERCSEIEKKIRDALDRVPGLAALRIAVTRCASL